MFNFTNITTPSTSSVQISINYSSVVVNGTEYPIYFTGRDSYFCNSRKAVFISREEVKRLAAKFEIPYHLMEMLAVYHEVGHLILWDAYDKGLPSHEQATYLNEWAAWNVAFQMYAEKTGRKPAWQIVSLADVCSKNH